MLFGVEEGRTKSLLHSSWPCFKEKAKEGGRQRSIVCYTHDKPRHTGEESKQWGIVEGKMVSIRCAHWNLDISVCTLTITAALS